MTTEPAKKPRWDKQYAWWSMSKEEHDAAYDECGHPLTQDPPGLHQRPVDHNDLGEFQ